MKHNEKGLTIIETLLYMGLFAILLTVFTQVFVSMLETRLSSESFSYISGDSKFLEQKILGLLRASDSVISPTTNSTSNSLQVDIGGVAHTLSLSSGNLYLSDGAGSFLLNSSNVIISSFSVTNTGDKKIEITATINSSIDRVGVQDSTEISIIHNVR